MTHRARLPAPRAFPALQRGSCLPAEPHTARVEPVLAGVAANHAAAAAAAATRVLVPGGAADAVQQLAILWAGCWWTKRHVSRLQKVQHLLNCLPNDRILLLVGEQVV